MGARVRSAFGWAGLIALVAGVVLLWAGRDRFAEGTESVFEGLTPLAWWTLVLGIVAVGTVLARGFVFDEKDEPVGWRPWKSVAVRVGAAGAGEGVPIPAQVTRAGWTWEPAREVLEVSEGPRGPVVRHLDGFVGLDGTTGKELWSYRLPYARKAETGVFPGAPEHVYLLHREDPGDETRTLVVLDTATGEIVREPSHSGLTEEEGPVLAAAPLYPGAPRWEFPLEDEPPGRVCLEGSDDAVLTYGDRVLITWVCLDAEHLPEGRRDMLHAPNTVPDDAVESVIALDAATGEEVWRRTGAPEDLLYPAPPRLGLPVHEGAGPVVLALGEVFDLATGEPVDARPALPEEPLESGDRLWAVDTAGAVTLRDPGEEEPSLVLRTDANGEVVQRIEGDRTLLRHQLENPLPLAETVVAPVVFHDRLPEDARAVALLPWAEGLGEDDVEWIDLGTLAEEEREKHRVLAVPGSAVSYVRDSALPLYGLVP